MRRVEKVETAVEPNFQQHFVDAMAIPHRHAPYPNLARAVKLPEAPTDEGSARRRRGARLNRAREASL